ncbi:endolytic transglycosylase MltG [Candidatus Kaiserbacteria bacterium]|nr:endolytic transglycosylase MltG [Candidatus Kaiserbacteria bacterium]MCB9811486.1 endolytic transglycosylase MltG [Candidatus Nomurabacteria bacterium]
MKKRHSKPLINSSKRTRILVRVALGCFIVLALGAAGVLKTKELLFFWSMRDERISETAASDERVPFPLGVDPAAQRIVENPAVDQFFGRDLASVGQTSRSAGWLSKLVHRLAQQGWYQNLASPTGRVLVIEPGERREQVADNFGDILRWDRAEREQFLSLIAGSTPPLRDGKYFPGHYLVNKDASPQAVAERLLEQFKSEVADRYPTEVDRVVPLTDALTIASLLEREAYSFEDMREIAGVIWSRLFIGMNLQLDATLQYAKSDTQGGSWWPLVVPDDKYIDSPFNTYQNAGLPPSPIASPSVEAIVAALNPKATDCLFYFHDERGGFHCSTTYEEHVSKLKDLYGQGR